MKSFKELGFSPEVLKVIEQRGFRQPSEIQEKTIPLALAGKDIIGGSATGSGKTLAFAAPILENIKGNNGVQALILTPTRELAEQIAFSIKKFAQYKKLNVLSIYGGVSIEEQIRKIPKTDIVVGTPGRILDHLGRTTLDLKNLKILVLDEVDRMFDMGFSRDVEKILDQCPRKRQTMLFSATISADIDHLAQKHTTNAQEIAVESYIDHSKLKQIYYDAPSHLKFSILVHLLKEEKSKLVIVFCSTRRNVDFIVKNLQNAGIHSIAIHGGLAQNKRTKVLGAFQGEGANVLVCTDVAARGLDVKGISHVYNYDLPKTSTDYIHRIGRTARAGKEGKAINIVASRDYENFSKILEDDSLKIEKIDLPRIKVVSIKVSSPNRGFNSQDRGRYNSSNRRRSDSSGKGRYNSSDRGRSKSPSRGKYGSSNRGRPNSLSRGSSNYSNRGRRYGSSNEGRSNSSNRGRFNSRNSNKRNYSPRR